MQHKFLPDTALFILVIGLCLSASQAYAAAYVLRFSDTPTLHAHPRQNHQPFRLLSPMPRPELPAKPAEDWLQQNGWQRVWPRLGLGKYQALLFDGPAAQRYLRIDADSTSYIWTRKTDLDPNKWPIFEITWGVDRFPQRAALDVYKRNDLPIAIIVSFGPKVSDNHLLPNVPRGLAFFWDETATIDANYTCVPARNGPADKKLQCIYPHIKYIALRNGSAGTRHTDKVNLVEHFKKNFPNYWRKHQRVPPIVAISVEARSNDTDSTSNARLYALTFTTPETTLAPPPTEGTLDGN